jgi:N-acetylglucosamine-6-phosphate deacetylase
MMTVAPEVHSPKELKALCKWALSNKVVLSIGHSDATEDEARAAFDLGFKSVTHAWNAMPFTHRNPGILAAALGRKDVYLGVIPDGLHVHTAMARFAFEIAPKNTYFISDAAPALGLKKGQTTTFGPLTIFLENGASRIKGGALSGGGRLLSESYPLWVKAEAKRTRNRENLIFKHAISACTTTPLKLLGLKK